MRKQRIAISQADIRKKCKLYKALMQGYRAFRNGRPRYTSPYNSGSEDNRAWDQGWNMAEEKQREKENDEPT